jgi:hypothetical protein
VSEVIKSEELFRRKALSPLGLVAGCNFAASFMVPIISEAEVQTTVWSAVTSDAQDARSGASSAVTERSALDRAVLEIPDVVSHDQIRCDPLTCRRRPSLTAR